MWDDESENQNEKMNACIYTHYKIKDQQHLLQEEDGPEVEDEYEDEDEEESGDEWLEDLSRPSAIHETTSLW